jgi:hypothetical protein
MSRGFGVGPRRNDRQLSYLRLLFAQLSGSLPSAADDSPVGRVGTAAGCFDAK